MPARETYDNMQPRGIGLIQKKLGICGIDDSFCIIVYHIDARVIFISVKLKPYHANSLNRVPGKYMTP